VNSTLDKAVRLIDEAGRNKAELIVFPEGWLPCFSYWCLDLHDILAFKDIWAKYLWSSIEVPGPETEVLCSAAKSANAYVVIGINEKDKNFQGRMYNSMLFIGRNGQIMGTHRKICNTVHERLFHVPGDGGDNLKTVFSTEIGKIGGSICGEHQQLPLIYNWIMQGIQVHCSLWPGYTHLTENTSILTRSLCICGKSYGVLSAGYIKEEDRPQNFYGNSHFNVPGALRGGSGIINPRGEYIAGPIYDEETIVYGDIDLAETDRNRYAVNLSGIYSRWDLLSLNVSQKPCKPIVEMNKSETLLWEQTQMTDLEDKIQQLDEKISSLSELVRRINCPNGQN
jgi:predicted amidohydrolase